MTTWLPRETAPLNEPLLAALIIDKKVYRVSDAYRTDLGFYTTYGGESCHWTTHWMPMPQVQE